MHRLWFALAMVASLGVSLSSRADELTEGIRAAAFRQYGRAQAILLPLAEAGNARAQLELAMVLINESPLRPADPEAAITWLQRAVTQGNGAAMATMAWWHEAGVGLARDLNLALRWYERAIVAGVIEAEDSAARLIYRGGIGLPADREAGLDRAYRHRADLEAAAERGDVAAMRRLGLLMIDHPILGHDEVAARTWLSRAAHAGDAEAQYHYANLLDRIAVDDFRELRGSRQGRDVPTRDEIVVWYGLSADGGFPWAERMFGGVRDRMESGRLAGIERRIREHPARRAP